MWLQHMNRPSVPELKGEQLRHCKKWSLIRLKIPKEWKASLFSPSGLSMHTAWDFSVGEAVAADDESQALSKPGTEPEEVPNAQREEVKPEPEGLQPQEAKAEPAATVDGGLKEAANAA